MSGRKEVYPEYKAQRTSRPDLLARAVAAPRAARRRLRLPQRRGRRLRGRRRDRLDRRARPRAGRPGDDRDRRPRRLPAHRPRVARAGHGDLARHHRHEDLRLRRGDRALRHPARADPRLLRAQGRHVGQHPRRPGDRRQDRRRSCCSASARSRRSSSTSTTSPAPSARRTCASTPTTRASRRSWPRSSATSRSTSTRSHEAGREPDRSRLREVFREFELRDPLRRLEEALGSAEAAAPAARVRDDGRRARPRGDAAATPPGSTPGDGRLALAVRAPEVPEGELLAARGGLALRRGRGRRRAWPAPPSAPRTSSRRWATRPVVAHDAKELGLVPARLAHDTLLAAFLLEPARRGFPFREITEERGLATDAEDPTAADAVLVGALAALAARAARASAGWSRCSTTSSCRSCTCCATWSRPACGSTSTGWARSASAWGRRSRRLEREIWDLAGEEFVIGSPQQLGAVLFEKLGLSKKRRGKTGFSTDARVLQAIRDEHEIVPKVERWRELNQLEKTYLDVLPAAHRRRGRGSTRPSSRPGRPPAGWPRRTRTCRTCRCAPSWGARSAPASRPRRGTCCSAPTTRRSSCGSSRTSPTSRCSRRSSRAARTCTPRRPRRSSRRTPSELTPGDRSKAKMINYGIVYGLSDYGLADRLNIPREEAKAFIDAYLERFSAVARVHDVDDRAGQGAGLRDDALRPPAPDPGAAGAQLAGALAGRAPGRQHRHPGHRGRRHEARDDRHPPRAAGVRAAARG